MASPRFMQLKNVKLCSIKVQFEPPFRWSFPVMARGGLCRELPSSPPLSFSVLTDYSHVKIVMRKLFHQTCKALR